MSTITAEGFWKAKVKPVEYLGRICGTHGISGMVRYNGGKVEAKDPRWLSGRYSGSPKGEKDLMREVLSGAIEEIEVLKEELTSQNRTTETFVKRNRTLQQDVMHLRVRLAESERKRYNLSLSEESTCRTLEEFNRREEEKITMVVKKVMNALQATEVVPDLEGEDDEEDDGPYFPPGDRYVQEVESEDERMKAKANLKQEGRGPAKGCRAQTGSHH